MDTGGLDTFKIKSDTNERAEPGPLALMTLGALEVIGLLRYTAGEPCYARNDLMLCTRIRSSTRFVTRLPRRIALNADVHEGTIDVTN
jgi:hypothetical protein